MDAGRVPAQDVRVILPPVSSWWLGWFTWYARRYLRRHFHSLRVSRECHPSGLDGRPIVLFMNHASWWDPLVGLVLKPELFPSRTLYAPMDAVALERYGIFRRLGFFGVEQHSRRGAGQFLRMSEALLGRDDSLLAITPQSRFADVRERPLEFRPGLGALACRAPRALFLPLAVEYVFWEERLPEILLRFGQPIEVPVRLGADASAEAWTAHFEGSLAAVQDALARQARQRDPDTFVNLLRGGAGQGGLYDLWQAGLARLRGRAFTREHGRKG